MARGLRPDALAPARTPSAESWKINRPGIAWCDSTRQLVECESGLEMLVVHQLDFEGGLLSIATQPFRLHMAVSAIGESSVVRHVPDFFVTMADGSRVVIDVHRVYRPAGERSREVFDATGGLCDAIGWKYRLITEPSGHYRQNLLFISGYRARPPHAEQVLTTAVTVLAAGPMAWRTLVDAVALSSGVHAALVLPCFFHGILVRMLKVPMEQPFSAAMPVSSAEGAV
ncbi:TnsA-like heteromeric transposase endonuclease subunit [Georgenia subflava]|nr:TnsA-like heteromeric transposase endonuclease subunit [Georgenia subflava]